MRTLFGFVLFATSVLSQATTPFTLTSISRQYDTAGHEAAESRFLIAVDRYGSLASVELSPKTQSMRQILDNVNHRAILIDSSSRMVSATPYIWSRNHGDCAQGFLHMVGASVSVERSAGTIQGVPVERVVLDAPDHHNELFFAPSLGCQVLRSLIRLNGVMLETEVVEHVQIGTADARLFDIPADYTWLK